MRGWRTPIFVSFSLHGALAATLLLVPATREAPAIDSEPVQIEIVEREPEPEAVEPAAPIVEEKRDEREKEKRPKQERAKKKVVEQPAPPVGPPSDGDEGAGGGVVEGTGPVVGPGSGKTKDGRDLSSLDLDAKISVPRFEEQGNDGTTIVLEEPRDPKRRPTKDGGWRYDDSAFGAHVRADGTVTFDGRGNSAVDLLPDGAGQGPDGEATASWTIDVNDWILSAAGDDPYSYEKRRFLEATREERLAMARAACGERLSASLVDLPKRLSAIWKSNRTPEEKREILFDLWDDCAEEGTPEVLRYGELARLTILDFIQKHLPEGSENAYSELEIDRLNGRRLSSRKFAPYGGRM